MDQKIGLKSTTITCTAHQNSKKVSSMNADRFFMDTAYVLALLNQNDKYHEQAMKTPYTHPPGTWPLNTEMQSRLGARESAALASSIYIAARKMQRQPTGFYNEVQEELKWHLNHKLERLWQEGVRGADRMLEDVRRIATDYAVRQILHNGFSGEISDLTRFYVLCRWNYGEAKVQFDEARKLAQSCGIDLALEWNRSGFISKEKEFIRVLGPQDRKLEELEGSSKLIDVLHRVLLLWGKSKRSEMISVLRESGFGKSEAFYRVAQAVSESLTMESKEKKLLDEFLAGRERLKEEVKKEHV